MRIQSPQPKQLPLERRPKTGATPIESRITILRNHRIILDAALAEIYGVQAKRLNQQVKRNRERFPPDFMFQITPRELRIMRLQFATSRLSHGGRRSLPYAFTEHGAIMAATVLNSKQAVEMSVFVVRAFIRLREILATNKEFAARLKELEEHLEIHDGSIQKIISAIRRLMNPSVGHRNKIGFALPPASRGCV